MYKTSLIDSIVYQDNKPAINLLMETAFSKEIRIAFKKGQLMKEHSAPHPIIVEIFEGAIQFGVNDEIHQLSSGDLISLDARVPHDLFAEEDSIVRLSLYKADRVERVQGAANL